MVLPVRGQQHREVLAEDHPGLLVERAERLVHQERAGFQAERAGQRRALAHAAGELRRIVAHEVLEPDRLQRLPRARLLLGLRHALEHHAELDVLDDRAPGKQRVLLEHEGDVVGQRRRAPACRGPRPCRCVGVSSPPIMLSSVLLPQPLGPIRQSNSPRVMSSEVCCSAWTNCGIARLAELVRDVPDVDRGVARGHVDPCVLIAAVLPLLWSALPRMAGNAAASAARPRATSWTCLRFFFGLFGILAAFAAAWRLHRATCCLGPPRHRACAPPPPR